jgi:hypothetical protein
VDSQASSEPYFVAVADGPQTRREQPHLGQQGDNVPRPVTHDLNGGATMSLFTESPFAISIGGVVLVVVALALLLQTTRPAFLYSAIAFAVITAALVVNERRIVTPREEVKQTLQTIARQLEADQSAAVTAHISGSVPHIQQKANAALRRIVVDQVKIKPNLAVELHADGTSAIATFNAVVIGSDRKQVVNNQRGAFYFVVNFEKEGNDWKIVDYERHDPRTGM